MDDKRSGISIFSSSQNTLVFFFVILVLILLGIGVVTQRSENRKKNPPTGQIPDELKIALEPIAPKNIVYGYWSSESSEIQALNLQTGKIHALASLPSNIKNVTVLSEDQLLYIGDTDEQDHGKEIVHYDIRTKIKKSLLKADDEFGIDEYVVSPNGQFLAVWEMSFVPATDQAIGGRSRVYGYNVENGEQTLLYDEVATVPVHYPRAVTDSGQVFADKWLPNSDDGGYGYGMSEASITSRTTRDVDSMQSGTYSAQPIPSRDGNYLAFSGYDGALGVGTQQVNQFRRAVLRPNTIEIFNVGSGERTKIPQTSPSSLYSIIGWTGNGELFFTEFNKTTSSSSYSLYNPQANSVRRITLSSLQDSEVPISMLTQDKVLIGTAETSLSATGNLGNYSTPYTNFRVESLSGKNVDLNFKGGYTQIIGETPDSYFASAPVVRGQGGSDEQSLQLQTFTVKPQLADQRTGQQSGDKCRDVAAARCNELLGTNYSGDEARRLRSEYRPVRGATPKPATTLEAQFGQCVNNEWLSASQQKACMDSPLYVYGAQGTKVNVSIDTEIYNANPKSKGFYLITTLDQNKMNVNGEIVEKIDFDYVSNPVKRPSHGKIVSRDELASTLFEYGQKLGLTPREISDTLNSLEKEIDSPFVFVSFFDDRQSKEILPISFDPNPDTYINVVFYLAELSKLPSSFPKNSSFPNLVPRGPLTAVEVSWIIE